VTEEVPHLKQYRAVGFLNTSGDVLTTATLRSTGDTATSAKPGTTAPRPPQNGEY
jgi:hypothetical protein